MYLSLCIPQNLSLHWICSLPLLLGGTELVLRFHSHFRVSFLHPRFVDLRSMASPAAVPKPRRRQGKVGTLGCRLAQEPTTKAQRLFRHNQQKALGWKMSEKELQQKNPWSHERTFQQPPDKKAETPHPEEKAMTMEKLDGDAKETKEAENPHPEKKAETAQTLDGDTKETKEAETPHQEEKANKAEKLDRDAKKEPEAKADPEVLNAMPKSESRKTDLEKEKKLANPKTKSDKALLEQEAAKQRLVIEENRKIAQEKKQKKRKPNQRPPTQGNRKNTRESQCKNKGQATGQSEEMIDVF